MNKTLSRSLPVVGSTLAAIGIIMSPVIAGAATTTGNTTINATVNAVISLSTSTNVGIALTPTSGAVVSSASDTISVSTNNTAGYRLNLIDSSTDTALVSGANTIAAHNGTFASPSALATNTWGYRVVGAGGFGATAYTAETNNASSSSTWAGIAPSSGSAQQLKTTSATASNDTTTVWYGVKIDATKPTGTYSNTVTYTAITN